MTQIVTEDRTPSMEWQPIETMPANVIVLLGWQGWPQIVRGMKNTFIGDLPDELWGFVPDTDSFPHGRGFRVEDFPPTHWATAYYPAGKQVRYPINPDTGGWSRPPFPEGR